MKKTKEEKWELYNELKEKEAVARHLRDLLFGPKTEKIENLFNGEESPRIPPAGEQIIDPITAYQISSMLEGVVQRGSGKGVNLPVPIAGKTGTTNDAKDVWFIGYSSKIVAGCYMGYDNPRSLGRGAYGGTLCVPVFQEFMKEAVKEFGGGKFRVPPGGCRM